MKRLLSLMLICLVAGNVLEAQGVISGTASGSSGRPLSGMTIQLVNARGTVVGTTKTAKNGDFTLASVAFDTYTLQCLANSKVVGTSSVALKAPTESIRITCATDAAAPFWKKSPLLTGLAAAAGAIGAAAIISGGGVNGGGGVPGSSGGGGDASGSR